MSALSFSYQSRPAIKSHLENTEFDLLVIGGGITGCGIALDAALRGMKVALVEKQDFAAGTSSRSTKLIHGGLRYLKQLEFKLVHDVGRERAIVFRNARHLVIPERMLLPIIKGGSLGKFSSSLGLWVYDVLAGVRAHERRRMLSATATLQEEPLLDPNKLIGGGLYYEYRTDDARLVMELAKSAFKEGALLLNYAGVEALCYNQQQQVCGAEVRDAETDTVFTVRAKKVVNAAGPFVDLIRKQDNSLFGKRLQLTKGVHLVFDHAKLPIQQAVYFDVPDGRMIFAIPRDGVTYVGTTDTVYNRDIEHPQMERSDIHYLLKAVQNMFPSLQLTEADIQSSWAGLRPLIYEDGKSPSELSRKDEIFKAESGLISIAGGKLTGYRLMAEKIVDLVAGELKGAKGSFGSSKTHDYRLSGGEFASQEDFDAFLNQLQAGKDEAGKRAALRLFYRYGTAAKQFSTFSLEEELAYVMQHEMCCRSTDFLFRRTGMAFFERPKAVADLAIIHASITQYCGRSAAAAAVDLQHTEQLLAECITPAS
ncbi:MAG: glycerol-3-phosphate dehydrogenase/oxidase [Chitinophagales bacterium]